MQQSPNLARLHEQQLFPPVSSRVMSEEAEGGLVENLRAKEEEVKILWNVIKEINKTKDKVTLE
jgi:hypothetical protein